MTCVSRVDKELVELIGCALRQTTPTSSHLACITNLCLSYDHFERRSSNGLTTAKHTDPVITDLSRSERYTYTLATQQSINTICLL